MGSYEDRFMAMKAAQDAMKSVPKKALEAGALAGAQSYKDIEKAPSKQSMQEAEDERMRRKEEAAPTTKTEMGKPYKKGGRVRGCGIAQRGLTKGRMV